MNTFYVNLLKLELKIYGHFFIELQMNKLYIMKEKQSKFCLFLIVLLSIVSSTDSLQWYQKGNPHFINQDDYNKKVVNPETRTKGVILLKFFTPWCRYCRYLKDIIDNLMAQQKWSLTVYEVNCNEQNYYFCGYMQVSSYPKMSIFENGQLLENVHGFYPYQVIRELFVKYNRTSDVSSTVEKPHSVADQVEKQKKSQQLNQIDPTKTQVKDASIGQNENYKPSSVENPRIQASKHPQPQPNNPQPQANRNPQITPSTENKQKHQSQNQQSVLNKSLNESPLKQQEKPEQIIEQQQNIAIVDQNDKQIKQEKRIIQDASKQLQGQKYKKQQIQLIDLTKVIPENVQANQIGKYIIYGICLAIGFYYFLHIMKAQPDNQIKNQQNKIRNKPYQGNDKDRKTANISIEDSEMRQQLHLSQSNEEQFKFGTIQIKDEDL